MARGRQAWAGLSFPRFGEGPEDASIAAIASDSFAGQTDLCRWLQI